jgi:CheY-like chemotaxis protein
VASIGKSVLIVDDDQDIAEVARAILIDEGYAVSVLADLSPDAIAAAVGRLEPDVIVLDGESKITGYGSSWLQAAVLASRSRTVPVVMFSAHSSDVQEAREKASERSRKAAFAGIVPKPFTVDELIDVIAKAAHVSVVFDRSPAADASRTAALAGQLTQIGAREVKSSERREWITFRTAKERLMQIYWWNTGGSYLVGRYDDDGRRMENIALAYDRSAAVDICAAALRADLADA